MLSIVLSFPKEGIQKMEPGSKPKFALCAVGVFVCYFYFGILQERITRRKYGEGEYEENFSAITALVFFLCVVNYLYAFIVTLILPTKEPDTTKSSYYALCSLTYLLAMVSPNKALACVDYPTQVAHTSYDLRCFIWEEKVPFDEVPLHLDYSNWGCHVCV